jgi:hypothetical protein
MLNRDVKIALATTALFTIAYAANEAKAASLTVGGDIQVRDALAIAETTGLNFGQIETPSSQVTAIVSTAGSTSGTANFLDTTNAAAGVYSISGSALETIDISVSDSGNVTGMAFTAVSGNYDSTTGGDMLAGITAQAAPGTGTNLTLGATLTIEDTVTEGNYSPELQIDVTYN